MRTIDADALIDNMAAGCIPLDERGISGVTGDNACIRDYINAATTIEVKPVRHGKWKISKIHIKGYICSVCNTLCSTMKTRYCCYCGAKMDLKEDTI